LTSFDLFFDSDDCIKIIFTSPVLPKDAKKFFLTHSALGRKIQIIECSRQYSDGADTNIVLTLIVKKYTFDYSLSADGEPAGYNFTFKCDYYG
jgi:hypothetical protein